ncbi:MAG: trypsin-like peptidase domain-containing protein [Eubacterium sp.]|nr:trypsin-like peptidase domain-containing protein [Eubacterium sp.]
MDDNFNNGLNPDKEGVNPEEEKQNVSEDTNPAEENLNTSADESQNTYSETNSAEPGQNTFTKSDSAAGADQKTEGASLGNTTYSWVNPRLKNDQANRANSAQNPWNSSNGADYWSTRTNSQNSRYSGTGSSSNYNYHSSYTSDNPNKERRSFFEGNGQSGSYNNQGGNYYNQNSSYNSQNGSYNGQNSSCSGQNYNSSSSYGGPSAGTGGPGKPGKRGKKNRSKRSGSENGRKWGILVAMALVFGLIAGTVTYGTNALANRIHPAEKTADASNGDSEDQESLVESGSEEVSSSSKEIQSTTPSDQTESTGSASADGQMSVADVASTCMPSMVTISTMSVEQMQSLFGGTQSYDVEGAGTGIIIGQNDTELLIASNNHVVENANEVSVGFVDESVVEASIKGTDVDNDVAVVAVKLDDISEDTKAAIREAKIGDSDSLALGEQVVAIGNALGYGQSVTSGYVSALNRELELSDGTNTFTSTGLIQTDAAINSGNSGGGLFNMKGELIGINEAKSSGSGSSQEASVDNIGFAIPTAKALPILQELMKQETKEVIDEDKRGYLGVSCADVSDEYSQLYDMPEGVCFTSVMEGGPAEKAGAKKGDVLVEFDGQEIKTYEALKDALKYHSAGDTVEITVKRADNGEYKEVKLNVTLATADEAGVTQNNASAGNGQQPGQGQQPGANGSDGADSGNGDGDDSQGSQSSPDGNSQDQQDSQGYNPFKGTPFEDFFGF